MSEWHEENPEPAPRDWDDLRNKVLIGAGCALVVIAWMMFARPGEEASSTRGFNMGSEGGASSGAPGRPFAERPKTSLDMVSSKIGDGPAGVTSGLYAGTLENQAAAGPPPEAPAPTENAAAPPAAAAPAAPAPVSAEDEAKDLASAGIPTDAKGLSNLGAKDGMLTALAAKLLDHPKILAAIFNNKTVVNAFMSREGVKKNCESGAALKSYLSDSKSSDMAQVFPVIQQALSRPSTSSALVSALSGTEMVKRLTACPSGEALLKDPSAVTSIAMSNPKMLGMMMDPRGMAALAAEPKAAGVLAGLQSKMGGAN